MAKSAEYPSENPPPYNSAYANPNSYPINSGPPPRYTPQYYPGPQVIITTTNTPQPPPPPPPPTYSYNPRYPPQNVPPAIGWFERNQKNKPQSNSVGGACILFTSGGMNWAWSCYSNPPVTFEITLHMRLCWFIAAIIGAIVASVITRRIQTKLIYICSGILVTMGGILFLAQPHNAAAITAARYLDGFGVGMLLVPVLVLAGEEVVKEQRGMVSSLLVSMCFSLGIFLNMIFAKAYTLDEYDNSGFGGTELQGLLSTFYGAISILMSYFLVVESPVYYLMRNQEHEAVESLRRLQRPFVVSFETYEWLEELKRYVADNKENGGNGIPALIKLCLYQGLTSLSFSSLIFKAFNNAAFYYAGPFAYWPFMTFGILRWLGTFIAGFAMDSYGRKMPMKFGCVVSGALAIGIGSIYADGHGAFFQQMGDVTIMLLIMQLFAGFFISSAPVYNTEAYPLALKQYFIAIGFIVEMLVQIIVCTIQLTLDNSGPYFITMGALYIVFFLISWFIMPETRRDTLRVAQEKFR